MTNKFHMNRLKEYIKDNIWIKGIYILFVLLIAPFQIVFFGEMIFRESYTKTWEWVRFDYGFYAAINYILVFLILLSLYCVCNKIATAYIVTAVTNLIIAIVNTLKYSIKGDVFELSDVKVAKEVLLVLDNFNISIGRHIAMTVFVTGIISAFLIAISRLLYKKETGINKTSKYRIIRGVICIILCFCVYGFYKTIPDLVKKESGSYNLYIKADYYREAGVLAGLSRTSVNPVSKPDNYGSEMIKTIVDCMDNTSTTADVLPNIIFIMSESLYDITVFDECSVNQDPLASFKELQEQFVKVDVLSPTIGGGTCQVEYEVITGYPAQNTTGLVYPDYINSEIVSIIDLVNRQGYETVSIHPNTGLYFNRDEVYRYMGFDKSIFRDEMEPVEAEGFHVSDRNVFDEIIKTYNNKKEGVPLFSYVITMQNHAGYNYEYTKNGITVTNPDLDEEQVQNLTTYTNLVYESGKELERLLDYFSKEEEPVLIVVFGDHAPGVDAIGFSWDNHEEDYYEVIMQLKTTPGLIWNNYGLPSDDWGYVSAYKLGAKVLEYAGIGMDEYFTFVAGDKIPSGTDNLYMINNEMHPVDQLDNSFRENLDTMWILQYDRMFGKKYSIDDSILAQN